LLKIQTLKNYFIQYKPFLLFLGKFFLSYLILTFLYQIYLNQFDANKFEIDGFTKSVATQTETVLTWFDSQSYSAPHLSEPSMKIFYHNKYVSRIIEGCNALSVIILFAAFVIAFSGKLKHTLVFIVLGSLIIHVLNVIRIALLSVAMFKFPAYEHILHGVVFPLFIYSVVFLLWVIWVNKYSFYATETAKK
jgi:exosortase family protein XrtF